MRTLSFFCIIVIILTSCTGKNGKSDAFGNFETVEVLVSTEIQGKLAKLDIEEGKVYKAGEIIALIDTVQLSLRCEQLKAMRNATAAKTGNIISQIDVQEEQKRVLLVDKARIELLLKDKAVPVKQLDDVNGKIKVIDSQIESIKTQNSTVINEIVSLDKQIEQLNDQIKRCKIVNPINGTVLEKYMELSEIALPGRAIYKIADMEKMILRVYVSGAQLSSVVIGQKVKVFIDKDATDKTELEGTISWVSPQAEFTPKIIQTKEERVNLVYAVKISVVNNGSLKIGMPGEVKF